MPLLHSRTRSFRTSRIGQFLTGAPVVAALVMFQACLDTTTENPLPAGAAIRVNASLPTAEIAVNKPSISAITITRVNGYQGFVTLTADSVPAGVTATFDPSSLSGQATTSILTLTAADSALAKTTLIKIKAAGVEVNTDSANVNVTVVKAALGISAATGSLSIAQGGSGTIPLNIQRQNGFGAAVTLLAEGLPANVTATFAPPLVATSSTVSTLTLAALPGAAVGAYPVAIRARSPNIPDKTIVVQLSVTASATPGFSIVAAPANFSLVAGATAVSGGTGQSTLTVLRTGGFAGTVTLGLSGAPTGVTGVITPGEAGSNTATLALAAGVNAAPGMYSLLVTGNSAGQESRTIPIGLTITPIPAVTVALSPATLKLAPGAIGQVAVLLTRVGGLTGDFDMTVTGLPSTVVSVFSPSPVQATVTTLTFQPAANTVPGVYTVTVKAAAGSDSGTATFVLTIGN